MAVDMKIWTGYHWCSPVSAEGIPGDPALRTYNQVAQNLFQQSQRWGTVILLEGGNPNNSFKDACDKVLATLPSGQNLYQCIARIKWGDPQKSSDWCKPSLAEIPNVAAATTWLTNNGYIDSLNYFIGKGGRMVVIFNELNMGPCRGDQGVPVGELQAGIDPRVMGYLSFALINAYYNQGNRLLYTLFPGPGGNANGIDLTAWNQYWDTYDLRSGGTPRTFRQVYGTGNVDDAIADRTMLWHGGTGVFDRVALHAYADGPNVFSSNDPNTNPALRTINWYVNNVDSTGWCYVTECGGQCSTAGLSCFGDSYDAGKALADFEVYANNLYGPGTSPGLLQGIYGYILDYSTPSSNSNGQHEIGNPNANPPWSSSEYLRGYTDQRNYWQF